MDDTSSLSILRGRDQVKACALGICLGALLGLGFTATATGLFLKLLSVFGVTDPHWAKYLGFPVLALLFYSSIPQQSEVKTGPVFSLIRISLLPLIISAIYGKIRGFPSLWSHGLDEAFWWQMVWIVVCIPIGEEALFRGWLYRLSQRIWPKSLFSMDFPLPTAIIVSSLGFSFWHSQNLSFEPIPIVVLQLGYTLIVGFWLGYLRMRTGKILPGILAHGALNLAAHLI